VTYNCLKAGIEDFSDVSWAFAIEQSLSYLAALLIRQFWFCPELDTTRLCFGPPDANEFLMVGAPHPRPRANPDLVGIVVASAASDWAAATVAAALRDLAAAWLVGDDALPQSAPGARPSILRPAR
jgi:hypothetical protein